MYQCQCGDFLFIFLCFFEKQMPTNVGICFRCYFELWFDEKMVEFYLINMAIVELLTKSDLENFKKELLADLADLLAKKGAAVIKNG